VLIACLFALLVWLGLCIMFCISLPYSVTCMSVDFVSVKVSLKNLTTTTTSWFHLGFSSICSGIEPLQVSGFYGLDALYVTQPTNRVKALKETEAIIPTTKNHPLDSSFLDPPLNTSAKSCFPLYAGFCLHRVLIFSISGHTSARIRLNIHCSQSRQHNT